LPVAEQYLLVAERVCTREGRWGSCTLGGVIVTLGGVTLGIDTSDGVMGTIGGGGGTGSGTLGGCVGTGTLGGCTGGGTLGGCVGGCTLGGCTEVGTLGGCDGSCTLGGCVAGIRIGVHAGGWGVARPRSMAIWNNALFVGLPYCR
jgi:hypothetical protein